MAKQKCIEYGLLSPIYNITKRNGCWFCPNLRKTELKYLYYNHKNLWDKLLDLSKKDIANPYLNAFEKTTMSYWDEQFRLEDAQMTVFDFIK